MQLPASYSYTGAYAHPLGSIIQRHQQQLAQAEAAARQQVSRAPSSSSATQRTSFRDATGTTASNSSTTHQSPVSTTRTGASSFDRATPFDNDDDDDDDDDDLGDFRLNGGANVFVAGEAAYLSYFTKESMQSLQRERELEAAAAAAAAAQHRASAALHRLRASAAISWEDGEESSSRPPPPPPPPGSGLGKAFFPGELGGRAMQTHVHEAGRQLTEEEALLPRGLLDELEEPSHERWSAGRDDYHQCCGAVKNQKKTGATRMHECGVHTRRVKYYSQLEPGGPASSIW
jgi:hypothetical protein